MQKRKSSDITKMRIADSLKKTMKKKPFGKITVSEIIEDCGINRKTFYYHFEDIYALLRWMFEQEAIEVVKSFDFLVDYEEAITFIMDYIEKNDYTISCAYDSIGRDELKRFFSADFYEIIISAIESAEKFYGKTLEPDYKKFLGNFYMEAFTGMMIDWIKERHRCDRSVTVNHILSTIHDSLAGILLSEEIDSKPKQ